MPARKGLSLRLNVTGAPVVMVNEATTNTGDNKTYRVTSAVRRVWDPELAVTVNIGGVAAAEAYTINRLRGTVTFAVANPARGAVTVSTSYLPLSAAAEAKGFTLRASAKNAPDTAFGDTDVTRVPGLSRDVSGSANRWTTADRYFSDALEAGSVVVVEVAADDGATVISRARVRLTSSAFNGATAELQEESVDFEGTADADGRAITFLE